MAIVQISRITNRKGLQENLPQLAGAELGWSTDTRRLFIGNGTLEDGAPVIGNTEILTEFSDILAFQTNYTYQGEAAGYTVQTGPSPGTPVTQSLQSWLDQFATVKDFGAVGDGVTDDTDAINRALYQLFCRESNTAIRRSLFFPAGTYRVTDTILIPPFAKLYGEGMASSVIKLDASATGVDFVARTTDSLQQTGVNITNNGAVRPQYVTISDLKFDSGAVTNVFLAEDVAQLECQRVSFSGPLTVDTITSDADNIAGVRFSSTSSLITRNIVFDSCLFTGTTYGITTTSYNTPTTQVVRGIAVGNSEFVTLFQGVVIGENPLSVAGLTPTGVRVTQSTFPSIYAEGIYFGNYTSLNATGYNIFYDVGNHFNGTGNPATSIIVIESNNNVSVGDTFSRTVTNSQTYPRIKFNNRQVIQTTNGEQMSMGTYTRQSGILTALADNVAIPTTAITLSTTTAKAFSINYTITRGDAYRTGTLTITAAPFSFVNPLTYTDDYIENVSTGITLSVTQSGNSISVKYTSGSTGVISAFAYTINYLTV